MPDSAAPTAQPTDSSMPSALHALVDDFHALTPTQRLELLIEFSASVPALPARYAEHPERLESVPECQSPIAVAAEVALGTDGTGGTDGIVRLFFAAPPTAPTTSGFAGVLHEGLDGSLASEVLAVPADLVQHLGLGSTVSPLRLNGMTAMLARIQRQVREANPR